MKTLAVGICIIVVVAIWFGGWYVYEDYELWNEFSPSKFQYLLIGSAAFAVAFVTVVSDYYSKKAKTLEDARKSVRDMTPSFKKSKHNPSFQSLLNEISELRSSMEERFNSLESQIEDIGIARALEPKKKRGKK